MAIPSHSVDVTRENFDTEVTEVSHGLPVVVDFWAPWCGPCQSLMPILAHLAEDYAGAFRLAKVNIDEQPDLATRFGVRSVPTVKVVRHGEVIDEFLGALTEAQIRAVLDRHVERPSDNLAAQAMARIAQGEVDAGFAALREAIAADPENERLQLILAEALLQTGDHEGAAAALKTLPVNLASEPTAVALRARLEFASIVQDAPPLETLREAVAAAPDDCQARYQLGARYVLQGDYEPAMEQMLEILRRDRAYRDDAGRKGLLGIFDLLGGKGALVNRFRSRMSAALY